MSNSNQKTIPGPDGLRLVLDKDQVIPDDPGQGTPAMVYLNRGRHREEGASTFWCAQSEGEVDCGRDGFVSLNPDQCKWLNSEAVENAVHEFLYHVE